MSTELPTAAALRSKCLADARRPAGHGAALPGGQACPHLQNSAGMQHGGVSPFGDHQDKLKQSDAEANVSLQQSP